MINFLRRIETTTLALVPQWLVSLALRVAIAVPFFRSGLTKWDGFGQLSETTVLLFTEEFKLNTWFGVFDYPFPTLMAYLSGIGEIVLPILVVLGLFTRFAGLGLLAMTAIIQLTYPDAWPVHLTWAAMALGVIYLGGSRLALDRFIGR